MLKPQRTAISSAPSSAAKKKRYRTAAVAGAVQRGTPAIAIRKSRNSQFRKISYIKDPELMHAMGVELCQLILDLLGEMGISKKLRNQMIASAVKGAERPKPSRLVMHNLRALSNMLSTWRSDKQYTGEDGIPRVIPIYGKGATLEGLARRFLPDTSVSDVLTAICQQGEVRKHNGKRVALVGSSVILQRKSAETYLASYISRLRGLSANTLHNLAVPATSTGGGFFERQVTGVLPEKEFTAYAQELRSTLQDLCDHVEAGLQLPNASRDKKNRRACGLALHLFREEGPLFSDK